jgi:hypothetical protein
MQNMSEQSVSLPHGLAGGHAGEHIGATQRPSSQT